MQYNKSVEVIWNKKDPLFLNEEDTPDRQIRVAAYCRTSTQHDSLVQSLKNQVKHFTRYIKSKKEYKLIGIYTDSATSGSDKSKRPGFLRLLRHCEERKIDLILTKSISRFSRNSEDLLDAVRRLKELNIGVIFEEEKISTFTVGNDFLISTLAAVAQEEIRNTSETVKLAYKQRFKKGIPQFKRILGYRVINEEDRPKVEIIEKEASIVQEIFYMYLEGKGLNEIAREMVRKGHLTQKGKKEWDGSNIKCILTNYRYTGNILSKVFSDGKSINDSKEDGYQYLIENYHEPIITQETFDMVQKKLKDSRKARSLEFNHQTNHLLGRVICGACGSKCHRKNNRMFQCKLRRKSKKLCNTSAVSERKVFNTVKKAFKIRYDFSNKQVLLNLQRDLERMNANDHFEYHRLSLSNKLEAAYEFEKLASDKEYEEAVRYRKEVENDFIKQEELWEQLEYDREYRNKSIEWVSQITDKEKFLEELTIERMRGWVRKITLYSNASCLVHWMDNVETQIGDCIIRNKQKKEQSTIKHNRSEEAKPMTMGINNNLAITQDNSKPEVLKIDNSQYLKEPKFWKISRGEHILEQLNKKPKTRKRVCAYCRVSTDLEDQKSSYTFQIAYYTYLIMKNPEYEFSGIYADEGISATQSNNRIQFQRMIADAAAGKFDRLITKSISRFARNTVDCLKYIRLLKSYGVSIFFEKENIDTKDEKSEVLITVYGALAQDESRNISENIRWGRLKKVQRGISPQPGKCYYGFDTDENERWKINEKQAVIIKRIYHDYLYNDKSPRTIAKELTEEGVVNQYGNTVWYQDRVAEMLESEKYAGHLMMYNYYKEDVMSKKGRNKGKFPRYLIEHHHDPIIDQKTWDEVQEKRRQRAEKYNYNTGKKYEYRDFSKKFYCSQCGTVLGHVTQTYKLKDNTIRARHHWRCRAAIGRTFAEKCKASSVRDMNIEHTFMSMLLEIKRSSTFLKEVQDSINRISLNGREVKKVEDIRSKRELLYQELYKLVKSIQGISIDKVSYLTDEILDLEKIIDEYESRKEKALKLKEELNWFKKAISSIQDFNPKKERVKFREDIFNRIVDKGTVYPDGRIIYDLIFEVQWTAYGNEHHIWRLPMKNSK